jgi:plasmid stabilization system protein ParE
VKITRKVLFRKIAQADLAEAYDWYRSIEPELAERLLNDVRSATDRIVSHPLAHPLYLGSCRRMLLRVFPYYLYYRLERGSIVVHALLHTRRNPSLHRKRAR